MIPPPIRQNWPLRLMEHNSTRLVPTKDSAILLLGYHKNHISPRYLPYIKRWEMANISDIGYMLTGILIQSENWGMSPSLYSKISKQAEEEFYRLYKWDVHQLIMLKMT